MPTPQSALALWKSLSPVLAAEAVRPNAITGLWWQGQENTLSAIVVDDIFGDMVDIVDRAAAMSVPGIARGRNLIVGAVADLPGYAWTGNTRVPDASQPTWTYRTDGPVSLWHRYAGTMDDLIFHDCAMWLRTNGADGSMLDATWIPRDAWRLRVDGAVEVIDPFGVWRIVPSANLIYFPGPGLGRGLLGAGRDLIRGARNMDRSWQSRVRTPIPPTLFVQKEPNGVDEDDVSNLIGAWAQARGNPETAATAFVPYGLEPIFPPVNDDSAMFIQGRNAVRLDAANLLNVPASLLDGSTATASLTYTTAEGQKSSFNEQTMRYWTAPIEHRLSQDDVLPRGQRFRFDITYQSQQAPTGEPGGDE